MVEKCNKTKTEVSFWRIKSITPEEFKHDLAKFSKTFASLDEPLDHLVHEYNTTLSDILSKHAPLKRNTVKITHRQPWFDDHIRCEIIFSLDIRKNMTEITILQLEHLLPTEAISLKSHGLSQTELLSGLHQRASF